VFRSDLGQEASIAELEALSGKKRRARLDAIKDACRAFIGGLLHERLSAVVHAVLGGAGVSKGSYHVRLDPQDPDGQTLLFDYPAATQPSEYVRSAVKIEAGAKSALDPNVGAMVTPYVAADLPQLDLKVPDITTVTAERTFWDKVIILHGVRCWFERRGELRHGGHRVSRHYYDVFRLLQSSAGRDATANQPLALDCARHARMFFGSPDLDLDEVVAGRFILSPTVSMLDALRRDYEAMSGMIFGAVPPFEDVMAAIHQLEADLNPASRSSGA
jgi:hypothetical protein